MVIFYLYFHGPACTAHFDLLLIEASRFGPKQDDHGRRKDHVTATQNFNRAPPLVRCTVCSLAMECTVVRDAVIPRLRTVTE